MKKRFVHFSNAEEKESVLRQIWYELEDLMNEGNWGEDQEVNVTMELEGEEL